MSKVSTVGLEPAAVLAALYNASCPLGMGFMQYRPGMMEISEAQFLLDSRGDDPYFDYLYGRLMKITISPDEIDTDLYDSDMGPGQGEKVIGILRSSGDPCCEELAKIHAEKTGKSVEEVRGKMKKPSTTSVEGGAVVINIGLADVAEELGRAIDQKVG